MLAIAWLLIAWIIGALPTGVVIGCLYADVDITTQGSGNMGATNMNRVLGHGVGLFTLFVDILKGLLPVLLAIHLWPQAPAFYAGLVGLAAFIGHCWSPLLDFRGGKGVATSAGAMLALAFVPALLAAGAWVGVVLVTKKSSLGAMVAVLVLPALTLWLHPEHFWISVVLGAGIVLRHKDNLARLRAGTET